MSRRKKQLTVTPITVIVEKFSHDGRGIARVDGKTTFIQGALPGETVTFQYTRQKKDFDEGRVLSVTTPSKDRVEPLCPHYSLCGGCSLQHLKAEAQIHEKQIQLQDLLERVGHVQPESWLAPLTGEHWHYRNKARLSVRYVEKKQATLIGFREKNNPRYITEINQCPVLNERVDAAISPLRHLIDSLDDPRSIAQIEVAAGDDDVALILRHLSPMSPQDEDKIRVFAEDANFRIFLQPGGPDSVKLFYPDDANAFLSYSLPDEHINFLFHPTDFTQVNGKLNRLMIEHALNLLALGPEDSVLDLFCGLGNFSLPMAKYAATVLGIEGSDAMVHRARMNAKANGLSNTAFLCANLEDESVFQTLKSRQFSKVLLDPPRTGALSIVQNIHHISPERIVYVSCNPATLARDADVLVNQQRYRMIAAGVMDMFVHTTHVESIALFEKG